MAEIFAPGVSIPQTTSFPGWTFAGNRLYKMLISYSQLIYIRC